MTTLAIIEAVCACIIAGVFWRRHRTGVVRPYHRWIVMGAATVAFVTLMLVGLDALAADCFKMVEVQGVLIAVPGLIIEGVCVVSLN